MYSAILTLACAFVGNWVWCAISFFSWENQASATALSLLPRTRVSWDNAQAESFWSTLKTEYYGRHVFRTVAQARRGVYVWID
ncbi:MAG: integrase core domain-containing protein, partial [Bifidobacteriaceae bacterium]|nr:integrase core domain-containing protein [Bifidobacteriaceae bacterium]